MNTIRIGSLNTQNSKINRTGGITPDGKDNAKILAEHIENSGYYFLGTQELTRVFSKNLLNHLKKYKLYGDYRYGSSKLVQNIGVIDSFNENNAIITSEKVLKTTTNLLPWFPNNPKALFESLKHGSIMPRIVTIAEISDVNIGNIYAINTHLDYQLKSVQIRQLKRIYEIVKILSKVYPVVLTGDFNMEVGIDSQFDEFIADLDKLGLQRISVNDKTNAKKFSNKTAIDHIFIPKSWTIEKAGLIEDETLDLVTDHKGVYADVRVR